MTTESSSRCNCHRPWSYTLYNILCKFHIEWIKQCEILQCSNNQGPFTWLRGRTSTILTRVEAKILSRMVFDAKSCLPNFFAIFHLIFWFWHVTLLSIYIFIRLKPKANFIEVSGHNHESSQTWGFRKIQCLYVL